MQILLRSEQTPVSQTATRHFSPIGGGGHWSTLAQGGRQVPSPSQKPPSPHASPAGFGACWQPMPGLQKPSVHGLPSSQALPRRLQTPLSQTATRHFSPSGGGGHWLALVQNGR